MVEYDMLTWVVEFEDGTYLREFDFEEGGIYPKLTTDINRAKRHTERVAKQYAELLNNDWEGIGQGKGFARKV